MRESDSAVELWIAGQALFEPGVSLVSQRDEASVEPGDNVVDDEARRCRPPPFFGDPRRCAV